MLAESVLLLLAREGRRANSDDSTPVWRFSAGTPAGTTLGIRFSGPELPRAVPGELVPPGDIPKDLKWRGTCRLVVTAPLTTLDLSWRPDSPLRILAFSRGDWEAHLMGLAARSRSGQEVRSTEGWEDSTGQCSGPV